MRLPLTTSAVMAVGLLLAGNALAQSPANADKQPVQSMAHEAPQKQPAQSMAHEAPQKQPAQSMAHDVPQKQPAQSMAHGMAMKQQTQSLSHGDSGLANGVTKQH